MARASPDMSIRSSKVVIRATPRCWLAERRRPDFRNRTLWRCIRVPPLLVHAEIARVDHHRSALYVIVALIEFVLKRRVANRVAASDQRDTHRANLGPVIVVAGRSIRRQIGGIV